MSTQTPNLNLTKQDGNENPSRTALNGNWDILDEAVGDLQESVSLSVSFTAAQNTTVHYCSARRLGPLIFLTIQLSTTQAGNPVPLVTFDNLPSTLMTNFGTLSNGTNTRAVQLSGNLLSGTGGNFSGASWIGGTIVYLAA